MDAAKRQKLKAELAAQPGVPLVSIERYFDGNDDEAAIAPEELQGILGKLEPDEIGAAEDFGIPGDILSKHSAPVLAAWWD